MLEVMLQLQQQKRATTPPDQQHQLKKYVTNTEDKINEKIYVLYGMILVEIKVVEEK